MRLAAITLASLVLTLPSLAQAGPTTATPWLEIRATTGTDVTTTRVDLVQAASGAGFWTLANGTLNLGGVDQLSDVQLRFDPDPFISASATVTDFGAPTQFIFNFFSPLLLGGTAFDYVLDGTLTATKPSGGTVTVGDIDYSGTDGLFFGAVDGTLVAASGTGGSGTGSLTIDPAAVTGSGSCTTCSNFGLVLGVGGAGGDAVYQMAGDWTLTASTGQGVPEPGTLALLAAGWLAAGAARSLRSAGARG